MEIKNYLFYTSIAQFGIDDLSIAIEIVSSNPKNNAIVLSKDRGLLTESKIRKVFNILFNRNIRYSDEIDYFGLCINLCCNGDVVFRWGDSCEEAEVALIYNSKMLNIN